MQLYTPESITLIIMLVGGLIIFVSGFSLLPVISVAGITVVAVIYFFWLRNLLADGKSQMSTVLGFIPGHYLIFLGRTIQGTIPEYVQILWIVLVLATLGYDGAARYWERGAGGKLTKITLYCIIWGVILFLLQGLLVTGLELEGAGKILTGAGLSIAGLMWVTIGVIRINSGFSQRRF